MKIRLIALLTALLLLLAACAAPAPESESTPPEPENVSEPEEKDVSNYYVDDDSYYSKGIEDREAVEALYWYLRGNLTPREYCYIEFYDFPKQIYDVNDPRASEDNERVYLVEVSGPDRAPIDALLQYYDGPDSLIYYYESRDDLTLYDLLQAEGYVRAFFDEHPELTVAATEIRGSMVCVIVDGLLSDELEAYLNEYPKNVFIAGNGRQSNPD